MIPFMQARHFTPANRRTVDWVVLHTMEIAEGNGAAEALMRRFAETDRVVSAHYNVDADSVTQSVLEKSIAYHAPGANRNGIGIEMAGRASQTAEQWADPVSVSIIARTANLTAGICERWGIPRAFVYADGLLRGVRGITTHAEVSKAFKKSNHFDPGPNFPIQRFIDYVQTYSKVAI